MCLIHSIVEQFNLDPDWTFCDWKLSCTSFRILDCFTVWFPPPELARQFIIEILTLWSERPLTTQALFVIPRVLAGFWQGLSRHLVELAVFSPSAYPLSSPPSLPIPIVVVHLNRHVRCLPTRDRLDTTPLPPGARFHQQAAEALRGLPSIPIPR